MTPRIVTLTSDFGRDWYAGAMRGAVLNRAPGVTLVDITHDIPPQDIQAGAFALAAACTAFPPGTIHVAVVDPGVGGSRRPLAFRVGQDVVLGPDNGLLVLALEALRGARAVAAPVSARVIDPARIAPGGLSQTFHGRDLFAPAAGALAEGEPFESLGESTTAWQALHLPPALRTATGWELAVLHVDSFGSLVTNLRTEALGTEMWRWTSPRGPVAHVQASYDAVPRGGVLLIGGSAGFIELAVRDGRASDLLGLSRGSRLTLMPS